MESKNKAILFLIFFICAVSLGQGRVYELGYLYTGSDTLDVEDGSCTKTKVLFNNLLSDSLSNKLLIEGQIIDAISGEVFSDSWGKIFLGRIDSLKANTWLGYIDTGLLIRKKEFHINDLGFFKIEIPIECTEKLIFTGIGCNVITYSIDEIKMIFNK